jgi:hypothetical protein
MLPQLLRLLEQAFAGAGVARRLLAFWGPTVDAQALIAPLLAVASVLVLALLTGVAVGTLSTLVFTLAALYLLLTEVFGVSIDVELR